MPCGARTIVPREKAVVLLLRGCVLSPVMVAAIAENLRCDLLDLGPDIRSIAAAGIDASEALEILTFIEQ